MEVHYYYCCCFILTTLCIYIFNLLLSAINVKKKTSRLPPGPWPLPIIGNLLLVRKLTQLESILRQFKTRYGTPVISLRLGSRHAVFITNHSLAYKALVQNGAVFSDRPFSTPSTSILNISSAAYGPTWRTLRQNLISEILHLSRVKSYSAGRKWVLSILFRRFLLHDGGGDVAVMVINHFRHAIFCLLVFMCFGEKLPDQKIHEIESVMNRLLLSFTRFQILGFFPILDKLIFRRRLQELLELRRGQEKVLIPLIRARIQAAESNTNGKSSSSVVLAYIDTLVDLQLPEDKRKLDEGELVTMCSEFLNAGTDTTSTALQWIIANLVKYPSIQEKLYEEIVHVVGPAPAPALINIISDIRVVEEEDLERMPYLKAIVLESLRRHPPGHYVLPHAMTEDVELEGYLFPKRSMVNFLVAEMGLDPEVWEDPMEFKPERFLAKKVHMFDITCSKEIKMMPFGAGRRICPAANLAVLHLEYFVANLIWYFEWKEVIGQEVDLSEKTLFTTVMKNPLGAHISPRVKSL